MHGHTCAMMENMENSTPSSNRQIGRNQRDCQFQVGDFFEKLMLWRDESQRQFLNIVNTHSNSINEAMNNLFDELSDLQVQLSVTRKERNDLIETVKNMSGKIHKQPDNEDPLEEMGHLEAAETTIEGPTIDNQEEEEDGVDNGDISNGMLSQETLNFGHAESKSTFNYFGDDIDTKYEGIKDNNIARADNGEDFGPGDSLDSNKLLAPGDNDEYSEAGAVETDVQTNVALPFFALKRDRKSVRKNGEKKSVQNFEERKFKCEQCLYASKYASHLKKHIAVVHNKVEKKFKCDKCPYASHKSCHMKEHIAAIHDKIKSHACGDCSYAATCKSFLNKHRKKVHNTGN